MTAKVLHIIADGRACAASTTFTRNQPIWIRPAVRTGSRSIPLMVPGFFDHYGVVRCQIVLVDVKGAHHVRWVLPVNVFARAEDE